MQGIWKEKISGYKKDCKRKKQSRKHTLKDKFKALNKKFIIKDIENEIVHDEANNFVVIQDEIITKQSGWVETWKIEVLRYIRDIPSSSGMYLYPEYSVSIRTAYQIGAQWYDEYDNTEINGDLINKLDFLYKEEVKFEEVLKVKKYRSSWRPNFESKIFIYGNPIPKKYKKIFGLRATKRRKYAQKMANRKTRARLKVWLSKKDYNQEIEIKNHVLEKSIAWEIY